MTEFESTDGNVVTAPMPFARFRTLSETYGAAPEHWPEAERAAARALLDRSPEARDALAEAALLDRVLATAEPPPPSDDLVRELDQRFEARRAPARWPGWRWHVPSKAGVSRRDTAFSAASNCSPQSQRMEPKASPVKHSLCTRTSTGSSGLISPLTSAMWST